MVKRSRIKRLPAAWEDTPIMTAGILPGGMVHIGTASKEEMELHRREHGRERPFIGSGIWTPSYEGLSDDALGYYLHWRDSVRRGRFIPADMGYIRLFVSELITFNEDPKNDSVLMTRLVQEYKGLNIHQIGTIGDACICHAVLNKLPLPKVSILNNRELMTYQAYVALCEDGIGYLSVHNLMRLMGIDAELDDDVPYDALYRRCIVEVESAIDDPSQGGLRLKDALSAGRRTLPVYDGLVYHGPRKSFNIGYPRDMMQGSVGGILRKVLTIILSGCGCTGPIGDVEDDIVTSVTIDVVQGYRDGRIRLEDAGFSLDPKLVEESQRDLDAVTEMMRVDDDDPEPVPSTESVEEDEQPIGWEGLRASLSEESISYIRAALEGKTKSFLSERGLRMTSVEKTINTVAMDMIGDIIVEDGEVIEDYSDEVKGMVGC